MTDNLALIEAAIHEINAGDHDSFGTLAVVGADECWLQYTPGAINAAYPSASQPEVHLATLPVDGVLEWKPNEFLSADLCKPPEELADWIDRYFKEILDCPPDYQLAWKREQ